MYLLPGAAIFTPYFSMFSKKLNVCRNCIKIFEDLLIVQQKNLDEPSCLM